MDAIERWQRAVRTEPWVPAVISVVCAAVYYGVVVAGEIGRSGSVVVSAVPAALAIMLFRKHPLLAMASSAAGILFVAWAMTNGFFIQNATQQSAAAIAIFGAARSTDERVRRVGVVFTGFTSVAAALFLASRWSDPSVGFSLGLPFLALTIGPWVLARSMRDLTSTTERLAETQQRSEAAERDVLLELERNRIAREVHDVVAHSLAVVIAQADGARFAAETKPASVAPALEAISDTARRALGEVRTMLHDLRVSGESGVVPGPDDLAGLVEGVRALGVEVEAATFGEPSPLDRRTGLAIYRIAQEALTNAMRHGDRLEPVGFELDWGDREVVLVVTNAVPREAVAATERAGHGITGMRERAVDAGGDCSAGIGTNGRFRVRVALPIPEPAPQEAPERAEPNPLAALMAPLAGPRG